MLPDSRELRCERISTACGRRNRCVSSGIAWEIGERGPRAPHFGPCGLVGQGAEERAKLAAQALGQAVIGGQSEVDVEFTEVRASIAAAFRHGARVVGVGLPPPSVQPPHTASQAAFALPDQTFCCQQLGGGLAGQEEQWPKASRRRRRSRPHPPGLGVFNGPVCPASHQRPARTVSADAGGGSAPSPSRWRRTWLGARAGERSGEREALTRGDTAAAARSCARCSVRGRAGAEVAQRPRARDQLTPELGRALCQGAGASPPH